MMNHPKTAAPDQVQPHPGPLARVDICEAVGLAVRPGGKRPLVGDLIWDFADLEDLPVHLRPGQVRLDFTSIGNPKWRPLAQEYLFARMAPGHEAVRHLPSAFRMPLHFDTCRSRLAELARWFNWLTRRRVTSLQHVTQQHCQGFYDSRRHTRGTHGGPLRPTSSHTLMTAAQAVQEPVFYNDLFTTDRFTEGFIPWAGRTPYEVAGRKRSTENVVQPLRDEALRPWLAAALYIVQTLGPHVVNLIRAVRQHDDGAPWPGEGTNVKRLEAVIRTHLDQGVPLEPVGARETGSRLVEGWSADDPLLALNVLSIAREAGLTSFSYRHLAPLRPLLERTVAAVGLRPRWAWNAAPVERADGAGTVPWTEGFATAEEAGHLVERVRTACQVVVALLTGLRSSELAAMPLDACVPPQDLGAGRTRYRLRTKLIKGQEQLGGVWDEWVTVAPAYDAVALAIDLLDPRRPGKHVFGRTTMAKRCTKLRVWVNGPEGQRLGLAPIPDDRINMRITRRTLAMALAHRPGGLLAAKIHLKHVSIVTTEGYAASPGGSQAKFMAEVSAEEQIRNKDLTLAAFRDFQNGIRPAGPGARDLIAHFESVDDKIRELQASSPGVRPGDEEVIQLLARRAKTLHLGIANYCWFADPSKALCLLLAGTPKADKPLVGMCDSARCPQATHHSRHRPVWASSAENKKVFIGKIGRGQKDEKARLQKELDRDLRVLAEIDAATGTAA
ncbi:site-specific integrase [Streptomyces wuyuanensis]|uniref:site-specific integrase n=1 Tax=Streptomyces wuyuanensis TaxID=1196353 RepID=UPI003D713570